MHGIHFYVRDGKVTLYGTIRHELDRDLIVSLVRQVPGVKDVAPHLQIADRSASDPDVTLTLSL
ncbi:MAG TPA: BON domain-containing protein [Rhodothermales bacterium]|nr:BON domain-containing protein [Rhodothermales bacterium]